ncbi:hypothetical protein CR513_47582, partial [Mucuna pruriens]
MVMNNDNTTLFITKSNNNIYKINLEDLNRQKNVVSTSKPLELLHMDLFRPTRTLSLCEYFGAKMIVTTRVMARQGKY